MDRIYFKDGVFFCGEKPVPPRFPLECEAELVIRLRRTRSGSAYWWAGTVAEQALNRAPRNPMLRAHVKWFMWAPAGELSLPSAPAVVFQAGDSIPNWVAHVVAPLKDPLGDFLANLLQRLENPAAKQGGLEIYPAPINEWEVGYARQFMRPREGVWLFNHFVSACSSTPYRVLGITGTRLLEVKRQVWVLSPDHPEKPVRVGQGMWMVTHDFPPTRGKD